MNIHDERSITSDNVNKKTSCR